MTKALLGGVLVVMLANLVPVFAHHSPAAFDRTKEVTLVGTVKEFRWQNPHTWIEVNVPDGKGKVVLVGCRADQPDLPGSRRLEIEHYQARRQGHRHRQPRADRRAGRHLPQADSRGRARTDRAAGTSRHAGFEVATARRRTLIDESESNRSRDRHLGQLGRFGLHGTAPSTRPPAANTPAAESRGPSEPGKQLSALAPENIDEAASRGRRST